MLHLRTAVFLLLLVLGFPRSGTAGFSDEILPILSDNCFKCHGPDGNERKGGLRLDTAAGATADLGGYAAVVPGRPEQSRLLTRIHSDDPDAVMPPLDANLTLSPQQKETLKTWIAAGARYEKHWALIAPTKPALPHRATHPIDAFVGKKLQKEGLTFSPEARPERLIRRVTLDLTGLPPTIDEVEHFVRAFDREGDLAYEALVDRLLASPRYGETMALAWLEASRFADTDGYQYDGPRHMWRWRDWVIDAYNAKMPFDQFTIEQLAGDLLPNRTLEQHIATGFNRNHRYNSEAGAVVEEFLLENAVDRVDTMSTLWMGLTMGCARCHDHKYDPISQKDYYQLIAFFNSIPESGRAVKSGNSEPVILAPTREQQAELAAREKTLEAARAKIEQGPEPTDSNLLINRSLAHHFPLTESLPAEKAETRGTPSFNSSHLELDGQSQVHLKGLDKALGLRADQRFTFSLWLRPDDLSDKIILSRQKNGPVRAGVEISLVEGGRIQFDLITRWIAGVGRSISEVRLKKGQWAHLTFSNDGSQSARGQKIYLHGQPLATSIIHSTNSNVGGVDAGRPLVLGAGIRPEAAGFQGAYRDLRLYTTDLWPEEIDILALPQNDSKRKAFARIRPTPAYEEYVKTRESLDAFKRKLPTSMVMVETHQPKPTYLRHRGVYNNLGEKVARRTPTHLPPMPDGTPRDRLGLARWLLDPSHPLTARVTVNRYWQKYFGTGLVKTAEDFGVQGEAPSHPELLDWLACAFRDGGWDVAGMQKLIVTSRTYRQQSHLTPALRERDPDNRLLARGPRLRLSGQAIRDQALYVSGLLSENIGGPSVSPYQPTNMWAEMSMGMRYQQSRGRDLYRRSLYTIWKRTVAPPAMAVFDAADREACWVKRKETNTPLQALTLLNETAFMESARHLAVRILEEGGDDPIGWAFQTVTARLPQPKERRLFTRALAEYRKAFADDPAQALKLISIGESPVNGDHPPEVVAPLTVLANVLLNLDETITRE
ncbi:MAG: DUF1553 domain-containing protein [Verrucomicrobiota bacterium]